MLCVTEERGNHVPCGFGIGRQPATTKGISRRQSAATGSYILRTEVKRWDVDPISRVNAGDTDVVIRVFPQGSVSGRVVSEGGPPIRNFTVIVRAHHPTNVAYGHVVKKREFKNSADGAFEIPGISEGRYVLQANANNYAFSFSDDFQVDQGITTPDILIPMTKGGGLKGRIVNTYTKEPIIGAEIGTNENNWIDSEFTNMLGGMSPSALTKTKTKTDSDGRFEIELVTPGDYQVTVSHPDYTRDIRNDIRIHPGRNTDLSSIELSSGALITGTVYASDGSRGRGTGEGG
jgi:hypothetical protein